jgi:hypothetical protein
LDNLFSIGQLKVHPADAAEIQRLLQAAQRNIADSRVSAVSAETRFDAAYKAIMQSALVAVMANGFRPDTNRPGHHMTVLQSLPKSIDLDPDRMVVLDALRRKRNLSDYMGEDVDDVSVSHCVEEAEQLLQDLKDWLKRNRPELIDDLDAD